HAGAMADRHQPDGLEALEGFTHGRMPDAEAACHLHDGRQLVALAVLPLLDQHPDLARQAIGQALLRYRLQCVAQSSLPSSLLSWAGAVRTTARSEERRVGEACRARGCMELGET